MARRVAVARRFTRLRPQADSQGKDRLDELEKELAQRQGEGGELLGDKHLVGVGLGFFCYLWVWDLFFFGVGLILCILCDNFIINIIIILLSMLILSRFQMVGV